MDLTSVILHLRQTCPILKSVAGASELQVAQELANLPLPAAYVVPLAQDAGENQNSNGLWQIVTESFAVVVCLDNKLDGGRGQSAAAISVGTMTTAMHRSLLNWRLDPDRSTKGLEYSGANLVSSDRARLWYRWVYTDTHVLTEADGYQPVADDLVRIDMQIDENIYGIAIEQD